MESSSIYMIALRSAMSLQFILLLSAACVDVAKRVIPDRISVYLAMIGVLSRLMLGWPALAVSVGLALPLFLVLLLMHSRGVLGGGDVKLLLAMSVSLPPIGVVRLFGMTGLAGGALVLAYLAMRHLPCSSVARTRSLLRRVYVIERWRILRRAPLPYGVAIACGGIWAILSNTGV